MNEPISFSNRADASTVSPWPKWMVFVLPAFLTAGCGMLCWVSTWISPSIEPETRGEKVGLVVLLLVQFAIYSFVVWGIIRGMYRIKPAQLMGWTLAMRVLLLPSTPILETDHYRYLWDGLVLLHGYSPYQYAPGEIAAFETDRHRFSPLLWDELAAINQLRKSSPVIAANFDRINHPDIPTVYMPVAQLGFALAAAITPGRLWGWRLMILLVDLLIMRLLIVLLRRMKLPLEQLAIYAWSPLVLKEYINTTHVDLLMVVLVLVAFVYLVSVPNSSRFAGIRIDGAGTALAAATLVKFVPFVVIPLWFRRLGVRGVFVCFCVAAVGMMCFAGLHEDAWKTDWPGLDDRQPGFAVGKQIFAGLAVYGEHWEYNSSLVAMLEGMLERVGLPEYGDTTARKIVTLGDRVFRLDAFFCAKLIAVSLFCMVWAVAITGVWRMVKRNSPDWERTVLVATLYLLGAVLLCSPVADPWYVGWLVPLLAIVPRGPWLLFSGTVFLYYLYFVEGCYLPGVRWLEYLPVYGWLTVEGVQWWRRAGS